MERKYSFEQVQGAFDSIQNIESIRKNPEELKSKLFDELGKIQNVQYGFESNLFNEEPEQLSVFEIVPGMTVEEMKNLFFDRDALIEPPYKVFQLNSKGHRYYYKFNDVGEPEFYPSVTTILSQTVRQSPHLVEWIANKGLEEAERYKQERANYGTFMHAQFQELLINKSYDLDTLKGKLKAYVEIQKLPSDFVNYADDLKKDVLAFAQFVLDYDVKPLAIEIALVHPTWKYAGMLDLPCTMKEKLGSKKRINAIIDFKSGRKGFYEDHEIQLHLYKELWNVNFEHLKIDRVFNLSPKDWRKSPSYNFKDQTESKNAKKIPFLLELAAIENSKKENVFVATNGKISLEGKSDLSQNIISLTLSEVIKSKAPKDKFESSKSLVSNPPIENIGFDNFALDGFTKETIKSEIIEVKKDDKINLLKDDFEL